LKFRFLGATAVAFSLVASGASGTEARASSWLDTSASSIIPFDLNGDGIEDLYVVNPGGPDRWLLAEGDSWIDGTPAGALEAAAKTRRVWRADADADGQDELHLQRESGEHLVLAAGAESFLSLGEEPLTTVTAPVTPTPINPVPISTCGSSIEDRAKDGGCLQAGSSPQLGRLLPLGPALFVSPLDEVGIGTVNPTDALTVAGTIETLSGGLRFPDGTLQTTATPQGPQGLAGPQGPQGPTGAQGPAGANGFSSLNGQSGPNLSVVGAGSASVSTSGATVTVSTPTALCTYANKTYSANAVCYTAGNNIPCSFGFQALKLQCLTSGKWQVISSSQCFNPSAGPVCGS